MATVSAAARPRGKTIVKDLRRQLQDLNRRRSSGLVRCQAARAANNRRPRDYSSLSELGEILQTSPGGHIGQKVPSARALPTRCGPASTRIAQRSLQVPGAPRRPSGSDDEVEQRHRSPIARAAGATQSAGTRNDCSRSYVTQGAAASSAAPPSSLREPSGPM